LSGVRVTEARIKELLEPYVEGAGLLDGDVVGKLSAYLELLLRWNARTNLTAITEPEEIVRRHFGESLLVAAALGRELPGTATVLDFGSGAGFPGVPVALACPQMRVTLAESQGKKAAFLREAVRTLGLTAEVWAGRVEAMPAARRFDAVTMRAVDRMEVALPLARERVVGGGVVAVLGGESVTGLSGEKMKLPGSERAFLHLERVGKL